MAYRNIEVAEQQSRAAVERAIKSNFQVVSAGDRVLRLESVEFGKDQDPMDFEGQRAAKLEGRIWGTSVYGKFVLEDQTGKALDRGRVKLMTLPQRTARHTYLYGGQEYQFDTQFRRKPGVYTRITDNGEYVSQISADGKFFRKTEVKFDPESKQYTMTVGTTAVPLSALIDLLGITQAELEGAVGREVATANAVKPRSHEFSKLYKAFFGEAPATQDDLGKVVDVLRDSKLDPDATEYTTGQRLSSLDKHAFLTVMAKLLHVVQGTAEEDDPNSLVTKSVHNYDNFLEEWITKSAGDITRKLAQRLPGVNKVEDVVPSNVVSPAVSKLIMSPLAQRREQHNVLDILSGATKATLRGPGGISDPNMVRDDMRTIHPSQMGFIDPIKTPEGSNIGTALSLTQSAYKDGTEIKSDFLDLRTGKLVALTPKTAYDAVIGFPDEFDFSVSPPRAKHNVIQAAYRGEVDGHPKSAVQFVPAYPGVLFTTTTNAIPFIRSNNGVRAMTASRQIEQAIPLVDREAPLVQVRHGNSKQSVEAVLGSHAGAALSPVDGRVKSITKGKILIVDAAGKPVVVNVYRNFPLNNSKGYLDSVIRVSVGDAVKRGQLLADTNFSRDGVLALGTNLRTAYVPWRGLSFDDAVVISESAARKLTSDHMHQFEIDLEPRTVVGKRKFISYFPNEIDTDKARKLDDDGVILVGQEVHKGDFVFAGLGEKDIDPDSESVLKVSKGAVTTFADRSIRWEKQYPGVVTDVQKFGKKFVVHIKTKEPAVVGDKLTGRHGNKGVISKIFPDDEMLRDAAGKPFDLVANPAGIVGRVNLGQVYETLAGKVAARTGKPVIVDNFDTEQDTHKHIQDLLNKAGVQDTETVVDPLEGPSDQPALTGHQYVLKLTHQIDKKQSFRGAVSKTTGERLGYSSDMTPARGGKSGGMGIGILDTYALLSHGATANLTDMFSYKGDAQNALYWTRLKTGGILPEPEVPYTSKKFLGMLEGMGVHTKKDGDVLHFMPLTDRDVERMSSGKLPNPGDALDFKRRPETGGIFDPMRTGGLRGQKYSHIELRDPVVNPVTLDGATRLVAYAHPAAGGTAVEQILAGVLGVDAKGQIVPVAQATLVGGAAVKRLLDDIDVGKTIPKVEADLARAPVSKINVYNKTLKYLRSLQALGYSPGQAYTLTKIPVIPPEYRPITIDASGKVSSNDVNDLYKKLGETVTEVHKDPAGLTPEMRARRAAAVQDMVAAVMVSGYSAHNRPMKSLMQQIVGPSPKYGFYQNKVLKRRQDLSARSTIVPNPELDMDTIEVPEPALWELYSPFVTRSLVKSGYGPKAALEHVRDKTEVARAALHEELKDRPALLKRDPVLHKFGIQAFYPRPSSGDTINIPSSVTAGYGADFDGDQMSVFVPSTDAAREEARGMVPSKNVFSPKSGGLMHRPEHEAQLGLYLLTGEGRSTGLTMTSMQQALDAYKQRRIKLTDTFAFQGKKTTLGRVLLASSLPAGAIRDKWYNEIAYNRAFRMGKREVVALLESVGKNQPQDFPQLNLALRRLGDQSAFKLGGSFSMADIKPLHEFNRGAPDSLPTAKRVEAYVADRESMEARARDHLRKSGNSMMTMVDSGARGTWDQLKQISVSPGLMMNAKGQVIPKPINRSYAQGLTLSQYWTTLHGARKGMISKSRGTALPGYLSRQIISSVADVTIVEEDCRTTQGIFETVTDKDILGRYLATGQKIGATTYAQGSLVDTNLVTAARTAGVQKLFVRTPLKCEAHDGICARCFGKWHDGQTPAVGTNIGVISGQSLGEPTTQMSMKLFHEGGLYSRAAQVVDTFKKTRELLESPQKLKDEAVLSRVAGSVKSLVPGATGTQVTVGDQEHFVPKSLQVKVKAGQKVRRGEPLSSGNVNVHGVAALAGVSAAQDHLVQELGDLYRPFNVDKRHIETVVKHMTGLGLVQDAPTGSGFSRGDVVSNAQIDAYNKRSVPLDWAVGKKLGDRYHTYGKGTVVTEAVVADLKKHGVSKVKIDETGYVQAVPIIRGVNTLPLIRTEDPLARMSYEHIKDSLESGALLAQKSDLSGRQPLPAVGFGTIGKRKK